MSHSRQPILVRGTGSIGQRHLRVLAEAGLGEPLALPARPRELSFAKRVDDLQAATNLGAKAAIIATNTSRHVDDALEALEAGYSVLVEKPLAVDAGEAARLLAYGERARVAYNLRFVPSLSVFRSHVPLVGRIHHVAIACQSYLPDWRPGSDYRSSYSARAAEGGVLLDLSHEVDYARWIFGEPAAVSATLTNAGILGIEAEEAADMRWEMESGGTIAFRLDYLTRRLRRQMTAYGEKGELEWDAIGDEVTLRLHGEQPRQLFCEKAERDEVYAAQARAFLEGPGHSGWDQLASVEDGVRVLAICDAARRSSRSGKSEGL